LAVKVILSVALAFLNSPIDSTGTPLEDEYEGVYLEVIKNKNILNVYLNNHIIYQFKVATGKQASATPSGIYQIITKVENPWYIPKKIAGGSPQNPLGTRWLGLNVGQTNGYKYGIHGTNNPASIGHRVSAGCIRMHNKDVEWLYNHIPLYTYVIIKEDEEDQLLHLNHSS
jgi:lipoprotein-anchoring transpeptidase ErfK/SrfK